MKTKTGIIVEGFPLCVKYDQKTMNIVEVYIGNNGGYNIRPLISDLVLQKIIDKIIDKLTLYL